MARLSESQMLEKLRDYSTPTIANIVANIPGSPYCLRIYDNEEERYYTDQTVHCIFPEFSRRIVTHSLW